MRPVALPLALALHLLALYALEKWSHKHHHIDENRENEIKISLLPNLPIPSRSEKRQEIDKPAKASQLSQKAQTQATISIPSAGTRAPSADAGASIDPPDPIITALPTVGTTDPADLVKANGYVDSRSELRKTIEAHGGTMEIIPKSKYAVFADTLDAAQTPYCLAADGLKHDPPRIGSVNIGGQLAPLFVVDAAIRGKCKIIGH